MTTTDSPNISDFNANAVMQELLIDPLKQPIEAASIRFLYKNFLENYCTHLTGNAKRQKAIDQTLHFTQGRQDMFCQHGPDFFGSTPYNQDAFMLALLCGSHVDEVNSITQDTKGNLRGHNNDGIAQDTVDTACELQDDVIYLGALKKANADTSRISKEAIFLAHVNAIYDLVEYTECDTPFDELRHRDFMKILETCRTAQNFIAPETSIGQELQDLAQTCEDSVTPLIRTAKIIPLSFKAPSL